MSFEIPIKYISTVIFLFHSNENKIVYKDKTEKIKLIKKHFTLTSAVPRAPQIDDASTSNTNQKTTYAKATANTPPVDQPFHVNNKSAEELKSILNQLSIALTSLLNKITFPVIPTP